MTFQPSFLEKKSISTQRNLMFLVTNIFFNSLFNIITSKFFKCKYNCFAVAKIKYILDRKYDVASPYNIKQYIR